MQRPNQRGGLSRGNDSWKIPVIIGLSAAATVCIIVLSVFLIKTVFIDRPKSSPELETFWDQAAYQAVNEEAERLLKDHPLDFKTLSYNGFAYFSRATNQYVLEDQVPLFDLAVVNLRKALVVSKEGDDLTPLYDALGRSYYHKGRSFFDLALRYLGLFEISLEPKMAPAYCYIYQGMIYSELEQFEKALSAFLKAELVESSENLFMTIGKTYYKMEKYDEAKSYLERIWLHSSDKDLTAKARLLTGSILIAENNWTEAEPWIRKLAEEYPGSSESHYQLGLIYEKNDARVKARAEWRKALSLDSRHAGAKQKLYR